MNYDDKTITAETVIGWKACYGSAKIKALYDRPHSVIDVLTRDDGLWLEVSVSDRFWTVLRTGVIDDCTLRLFAVWCAREALKLVPNPDPRSVESCNVAERYANGHATIEELRFAMSAAYAADAARAADAADAARAARAAQRDQLVAMLKEASK